MLAPELTEHTGFLLRRAQQAHVAAWLREVSADVTSVQFGVLSALGANSGMSQQDLCESLDLDRSTIADIVVRLERRALLERVRAIEDRRRNVVRLTAEGERVLRELEPLVAKVDERLVGALPPADQVELHRLLRAVLAPRAT
jgi:DNA-binding MarR family transcriptional regulator